LVLLRPFLLLVWFLLAAAIFAMAMPAATAAAMPAAASVTNQMHGNHTACQGSKYPIFS